MASSVTATLTCRVTPNARRSEIIGWGTDDRARPVLMIRLAAPAVEGKANAELLRFLAETLHCAKGAVSLLRGDTSRIKIVSIPAAGMTRLQSPHAG